MTHSETPGGETRHNKTPHQMGGQDVESQSNEAPTTGHDSAEKM